MNNDIDLEELRTEHKRIIEMLEKLKPKISGYWLSVEVHNNKQEQVSFLDFVALLKKHLNDINVLIENEFHKKKKKSKM